MKYKAPRGTKDIIWPEVAYWQCIEKKAAEVFSRYNYSEMRTPVIEQTELFTSGIGDQTDIVSKEMYTFIDKGNRSLTLRPEGTAPIVRACIQNGLANPNSVIKLYYNGPMFRYERPQAGRYRQFHQIGMEAIGTNSPMLDAEVIVIGVELFKELGIKDLTVHVNSVGCPVCRPVIREQLKSFIELNLPNLCNDCQDRFERNPMRILDCKNKKCQKFFLGLPSSTKVLCHECKDHINMTLEFLEVMKVDYIVDPRLVRGLDYYTKTVFEIRSDVLGAQNAICGGGRYDNLFKRLGGSQVPAVGFAFGMERTVMTMMEQGIDVDGNDDVDVYIIGLGHVAKVKGFGILQYLRKNGIRGDISFKDSSMSSQMKRANKLNCKKVIIIGEDEINKEIVVIKDMNSGDQKDVSMDKEAILENVK